MADGRTWPWVLLSCTLFVPTARGTPLLAGVQGPVWQRAQPGPSDPVKAIRDDLLRAGEVRDLIARSRRLGVATGGDNPTGGPRPVMALSGDAGLSCAQELCVKGGPRSCQDEDSSLRIARACSGNYSGDCVRVACDLLGAPACETVDVATRVAAACRTDFSGSCVAAACQRVGRRACAEEPPLFSIVAACQGNFDADCVSSICDRLGPSACASLDQIIRVARVCGAAG